MGGRERHVSLSCDVGHPYSGMEVPGDKVWEQGVCRDLGAEKPPACTGGWGSASLEAPASSLSGARSVLGPQWGFTTGCNYFQKNQLQAYLGFSAPSERTPWLPRSPLPYLLTLLPSPALTHLQSLLGQSFVSHSKSTIIA